MLVSSVTVPPPPPVCLCELFDVDSAYNRMYLCTPVVPEQRTPNGAWALGGSNWQDC